MISDTFYVQQLVFFSLVPCFLCVIFYKLWCFLQTCNAVIRVVCMGFFCLLVFFLAARLHSAALNSAGVGVGACVSAVCFEAITGYV